MVSRGAGIIWVRGAAGEPEVEVESRNVKVKGVGRLLVLKTI